MSKQPIDPNNSIETSSPIPDSILRVSLKTHDRDTAQSFLSTNYCPVKITSHAKKSFDFNALAVMFGGIGFSNAASDSGIEHSFQNPYDGYGMSVLLKGGLSLYGSATGPSTSRTDGGLIVDSREVKKAAFGERSAWQRIAVSSDELHRHITLLTDQPVVQRVRFTERFDGKSEISRLMFSISQSIIEGVSGASPLLYAPAAIASLRDAVYSMFVESMPNNYSEFLTRKSAMLAPRSIKRAIEFMHTHIAAPIGLEDIAKAADVSPRSLQLAFRRFRKMTPMAYLRTLRLNGVRLQLLDSSSTTKISAVAYQWGFAHHGLFASNYCKLFGEQPSATLQRRK